MYLSWALVFLAAFDLLAIAGLIAYGAVFGWSVGFRFHRPILSVIGGTLALLMVGDLYTNSPDASAGNVVTVLMAVGFLIGAGVKRLRSSRRNFDDHPDEPDNGEGQLRLAVLPALPNGEVAKRPADYDRAHSDFKGGRIFNGVV